MARLWDILIPMGLFGSILTQCGLSIPIENPTSILHQAPLLGEGEPRVYYWPESYGVWLTANYSIEQHSEAIHHNITPYITSFYMHGNETIYNAERINSELLSAIRFDQNVEKVERAPKAYAIPECVPQEIIEYERSIDPNAWPTNEGQWAGCDGRSSKRSIATDNPITTDYQAPMLGEGELAPIFLPESYTVSLAANYSLEEHSETIHHNMTPHIVGFSHFPKHKDQIKYIAEGVNDELLSAIRSDHKVELVERDAIAGAPEAI